MVFPCDKKIMSGMEMIKTEFKSNPNILSISRSVNLPTNILGGYNMRKPEMPEDQQIMVRANPVDEDYIKASGLQLIAGTDLSKQDILNVDNDEQEKRIFAYILNESACKELGWKPEEAVGKKMFLGNQRPGIVKGVIKDFHFESLHNAIKPLVLFPDVYSNVMMVKLSGNNLTQSISFLEDKWKKLVPHRPFEFHFLDEDFNKMYSSELRIGKVLNIFAGTAILLACLGLFGLSSYAAQQRIKEIGIRKVLGASVSSIVAILSKDFIKLATVATIIATPVAWWVMSKWLQDFTYRINMSWWIFVAAGAACVLIAVMTVSFQAIKAALSNPIKNLRTE
jgi:putative ABC transport system permease protein